MFKSRRRLYYQKQRRPFHPFTLLLAIPVLLIVLELLTRLIVGMMGTGYEGNESSEPAIVSAYRLKFLDQTRQPYDGFPNHGQLLAESRLSTGYQLMGNQQSPFWRINEQGFRDHQNVPQAKPKNEIRVFILGGSTAFGQMSSGNKSTFANQLEVRLNQRVAQQKASPDKFRPDPLPFYRPERVKALTLPPRIREGNYRVINAAVPGYASGNELAALALQILPYSPDIVVVLDGYADLMLPSTQKEVEIPYLRTFLKDARGYFWTSLSKQLNQSLSQLYLVKGIQRWSSPPSSSVSQLSLAVTEKSMPLAQHLPADSAELRRRLQRYQEHHRQIARLTSAGRIPLIVAIQPEITGRSTSKLSSQEQALLSELGPTYQQRVQTGYAELAKVLGQMQKTAPKNVRRLNLYTLYQNFTRQAFSDAVHLTDEAHTVMAERFYKTMLELPELKLSPPKPVAAQK